MQLTDFFAPLNLQNIGIFIFIFFILDAIGTKIASIVKSPTYLRLTYWIWGLAIVIFIWFIAHFILPFWPIYVWLTFLILAIIFLPSYLKAKKWGSLIGEIIRFPYPLFALIIVAKPIYFLLSAPPFYTDELAYHFYSPARIILENSWPFLSGPGLYSMMPKFLDTSFLLMFSLTKTYATARLLHFLIVYSSIYAIGIYLRYRVNLISGITYIFLTPLISPLFLISSTQGYVDAGAAIFSILFLTTLTDFVVKRERKYLYAASIIFGITISAKYTILAFLGSVTLIAFTILLISNFRKLINIVLKFDIVLKAITLIFLFGGYWYAKNFIMTGNPIYPFLFKCFQGIKCQTGFDYFSSWAIPLDITHFLLIRSLIFQKSNILLLGTFASLTFAFLLSLILKHKNTRYLAFLITLSVFLEILVSKSISGFELRYFYHWVLLIPLSLSLPFVIFSKNKLIPRRSNYLFGILIFTLLVLFAGNIFKNNIKRIYEPDFVPGQIRNYAMRRINLIDWIDYYYPKFADFIKWCGERKPMVDILVADPSLMWNYYEASSYVANCNLLNISIPKVKSIREFVSEIKENYKGNYIVSYTDCDSKLPDLENATNIDLLRRHEVNTNLICASTKVAEKLYRLPY